MFFIFPSGSASFANCQLTSVDSACLNTQFWFSACRPPPPPPLLLPLQPLHLPCCLHRHHHYPQCRCHPCCPQPLFEATVSGLSPPWLSLLPSPLHSTRCRRCHLKPPFAATVSRRCQSLLPPPPPMFSTVPSHHFPQSPLRQCDICRFWYITKNS